MAKNAHIVSFTLEELQAMRKRGETRSDPERAASISEDDLERRIAEDLDDHFGPVGEHIPDWRAYLLERERAEAATVTVEPDLVAWLRSHDDRDLETVVNDLIRRHVEETKAHEPAE
jgi:hypothetical protein